jgi:hypothetical protein
MVKTKRRHEERQKRLLDQRRALDESWGRFRSRLRRMYGHAVESRLVYLDPRWYEIRQCGWNPEDAEIWEWWSHLDWPVKIRLILMSKRCGMYAQSRKLWKKPSLSSS